MTLEFKDIPNDTTFEPATSITKHVDVKFKISFGLDDDAAEGELRNRVTGHLTQGVTREPAIVFNRNSEVNADFTLVAFGGRRTCER